MALILVGAGTGCAPPTDLKYGFYKELNLLYDPASRTFTNNGVFDSRIMDHGDHTATLLPDGSVLVAGGMHWDQYPAYYRQAGRFYPGRNVFEPTGDMGAIRAGHTATLLPNGKVLILGGVDGTGADVLTAELYQ